MARPAASLLLAGGILVVAAVPLVGIRTGFSGISTFPDDVQSKQAFTVLSRDFSGGLTSPALIVVEGQVRSPAVTAAIDKLQAALTADRAFGPVPSRPTGPAISRWSRSRSTVTPAARPPPPPSAAYAPWWSPAPLTG
jgi:uncharacterized membrane protein YdfJ with MMPL/SSD domain